MVFDDGAGLGRRGVEVDQIAVLAGSADDALSYAAAAFPAKRSARGRA
ncbi:hypothetical protein [Chenggangzhangella methanolivorans]|uniref:Uncharacterized protein n=2 Tax=Chenggangzhangella methanolivorans TaxID=1437009 RepID=A0A9E6RGC8_9HYPH|nr:hypothetical protein [Chenggangzhangella methanolivorans]QZO00502.1 hypothetical protein K6K41_01810 [Chenggangzhangella methanolivorans]